MTLGSCGCSPKAYSENNPAKDRAVQRIPEQINYLEQSVEELQGLVARLSDRLQPITNKNTGGASCSEAEKAETPTCLLHEQLTGLNHKIRNCSALINSQIVALEL